MPEKSDFIQMPIVENNDLNRVIGWAKIDKSKIEKVGEDSVFTIAYIAKSTTGNFELINLSLTDDASYKKFLDQKYGRTNVVLKGVTMTEIDKKRK